VTGSANEDENAETRVGGDPVFRAQGGSLYVVATPLGNLRDITLRALDILRTVDIVAAEDTRVSATLLRHYGIGTRMIALHEHNEAQRAPMLIEHLAASRSVALVTDAGTPAVSDPGARLVAATRAAGFPVVPIPGPSAMIAAISAAGLDADRFLFLGFLAGNAKQRRATLTMTEALPCATVLYEAPHRLRHTLVELSEVFGPSRTLVIAREITKRFESIATMPLGDALQWVDGDAHRSRGEFVLILDAPAQVAPAAALDETGERWLRALLEQMSPAQAARVAAAATGVARDAIYQRALSLKGEGS